MRPSWADRMPAMGQSNEGKDMFVVRKSEKSGVETTFDKGVLRLALGALVIVMAGTGCSSLSNALGSSKHSPDEFAVVTKAPLVMPPDFSLRPPRPGARPTQEGDAAQEAAKALYGKSTDDGAATRSDGERMLIASAGAEGADNSIRDIIDSEFYTIQRTSQGFANKILFWQGETDAPVVSRAEQERLRKEADLGQSTADD